MPAVEEQRGEQVPLFESAQRDDPVPFDCLHRTQKPESHHTPLRHGRSRRPSLGVAVVTVYVDLTVADSSPAALISRSAKPAGLSASASGIPSVSAVHLPVDRPAFQKVRCSCPFRRQWRGRSGVQFPARVPAFSFRLASRRSGSARGLTGGR
ncbi:hypothetical protein GCM10025331_78040 [Actinoplanes utahensis]|nr:hypothetical protein Aut01nite_80380 [Actinoplanes utahensis]